MRRRLIRGVGWLGLGITAVLAAGAFALHALAATPVVDRLADARAGGWSAVVPGGSTGSGNGDPYRFLVRPGDPQRLLVHFGGGGANWDAETAARPITAGGLLTGDPGYYFDSIPWFRPLVLSGILATDEQSEGRNPFADWTVVYIPYTTGDFHVGDAVIDYPDGVTARHTGAANARAALDWIAGQLDEPRQLLVSGDSAGGFGAAFWIGDILERYPDAEATLLVDGSYLATPRWPGIVDDVWQADAARAFGVEPGTDLIGSVLPQQAAAHPELAILQAHTRGDSTLMWFNARLDGADLDAAYVEDWSARLLASVDELEAAIPGYAGFVGDELPGPDGVAAHTHSVDASFWEVSRDGVTFAEWVAAHVR